jgi:FAD/FMN-containing dehydrogenase
MLDQFKIHSDGKVLDKFAVDASIFRIVPKGVLIPKNVDELQMMVREIINAKNEGESISISSRAAGTCMSGGSLSHDYIISFTEYLNQIHHLDVQDKSIILEPGVYYRDMEKATLASGLILPSFPASRELCAIGGMIGNNSAGEKTFKYGKTDKYIEEIEMICADGNKYNFKNLIGTDLDNVLKNDNTFYGDIHRKVLKLVTDNQSEINNNKPKVTKNSSGYYLWDIYKPSTTAAPHSMNLAKAICGAQGTLGVMTKFKIKLIEAESKSKMAVVFLRDIKDMPRVVGDIAPLSPESFEIFDDHTFRIAMKFLPQIIKNLGGSIISLARLFWPEVKMLLSGNVPKIVMLIEFVEKDVVTLNSKIKSIQEVFEKYESDESIASRVKSHIVATDKEAKKYWIFRRESFNLLRSKLKDVRTVPFIEDVVVQSSDLPTFLPKFEKILDEEKLVYTIAGHVGDGNIHVIPLMKLSSQHSIDQIKRISDKVYTLVHEYDGSLSGEHNDGLVRAPFLNYMYSDKMLALFTEFKNIFDPINVFNPNKKINVTWDYSEDRIDRRK